MYSKIFKTCVFPVAEYLTGSHISEYLSVLEKTQWESPTKIREIQENKLRALVRHSYQNVPYYHKKFNELGIKPDDIKSTKDLSKLPVLIKDEVKANFPTDIAAKNYVNRPRLLYSSSGSTGEPVQYFIDKNAKSWKWASVFRSWRWAGFDLGKRYSTLWGSPITIEQHTKLSKRIQDFMMRHLWLSAYNMTEETLSLYIEKLRKFKPEIIRGYASAVYLLAAFMKHENVDDIKPRGILTTAETLFDYQRKLIESQFDCKVFDGYGGETIVVSFECEEHKGYHIASEGVVVEFIKDGEHVSDGELGEIVVTDLTNYAMPFIRYSLGDVGRPTDDMCSCGRGLPLMKSVEGRTNDFIVTPEGKFLHCYFFPGLFKSITWVKQFQVVQETKNKLLINIVLESEPTVDEVDHLKELIRAYVGDMEIVPKFVELIPSTPSGKRRFVISKIPVSFL